MDVGMGNGRGFGRRQLLTLLGGMGLLGFASGRAASITEAPQPDRELQVPVRGGHVYVRVNGQLRDSKPPLLMIHGGPGGSHASFLPALSLADERAVILYDQLDCGRSAQPGDPANWTVERFVSEIDAIREALDVDALHILGASWGGAVALEYAARQPKGLHSLILQGPLISTARWLDDAEALRRMLPADVQRTMRDHETAGTTNDPAYQAAVDAFYARFWRREPPPAYLTAYEKTIPQPFNRRLYETMWGPTEFASTGTLRHYDGEPLLSRVAAPTLFLCGEFDEARPETCRRFAARMDKAKLVVVPGAAHRIQTDRTDAYVAAIRQHISRYD